MMNEIEIKLKGTRVTQAKVQLNNEKTFACVLLPLDWNKEEVTVICNPVNVKRRFLRKYIGKCIDENDYNNKRVE